MTSTPRPRRRKWLLLLGGLLLGCALTGGGLLLPPVQAWLLRRLVATQPGWRVDFKRFAAGAGGVESEGLVFSMPGVEARAEPLAVRVAPFALLRHRELRIEEVAARQLKITLTPAQLPTNAAPAEGVATAPFAGMLPLLRAPLPWAVLRTALDGRVAVRDGGGEVVAGEFNVSGGGVAAGQPGEFRYELTADSILLPPGPDNKLRSVGTLRIEPGADHGVARIVLAGDLKLPGYAGVVLPAGSFRLEVAPAAHGEQYNLHIAAGRAVVDLAATLDASSSTLTGNATFQGDHELLASVLGTESPVLAAQGRANFSCNLVTGETTADIDGTLAGREWKNYMPELSAVDALAGTFHARLERREGRLSIAAGTLDLKGEHSEAELRVALSAPMPLPTWPDHTLARVVATRWPAAWANPFLEGTDIAVGNADFEGEWLLHLAPDLSGARLEPVRPATVADLQISGDALPPMPPVSLTFSPRVTVDLNTTDAAVEMSDFTLTSSGGDHLAGAMKFIVPADETVAMTGGLSGPLPTLLTGAERPLPFEIATRWDATLSADGNTLDVRAIDFKLLDRRSPTPAIEFVTLQPIRASLVKIKLAAAASDLARLRFDALAFDWLQRWLPEGWQLGGALAAGESLLRQETDGAFTLRTTVPWELRDFSLGLGGREMFRGRASLAPGLRTDLHNATLELGEFAAEDSRGNRIAGRIDVTTGLDNDTLAGEVALTADLPDLPESRGTFGALQGTLRLKAQRYQNKLFMAETFDLKLSNAERELLAVTSPQPFLLGFNDGGAFAVATLEPLRVATGIVPLAWLQPWLPGRELEGTMEPAEFLLAAGIQQHRLRPVKPVQLRNLSFGYAGRPLLRAVDFRIHPGADLDFHLNLLPTFQMAYRIDLHGTGGAIDVGGAQALALDASLRALGNDRTVLPQSIELTMRADLGAFARLPAYAEARLPTRGSLVTRVNGDLLGGEPLEIWSRLEGVPAAADGSRVLPPVEFTARGKVNATEGSASAGFDVDLQLLASPRPSNARFAAKLMPGTGTLAVDSTLHSDYLDLQALLDYQNAFLPAEMQNAATFAAAPAANVGSAKTVSRPFGSSFWSVLRGTFELDLAAVDSAPYRIDGLRGRLEAGDTELILKNLSGEMFAGRWGGNLRLTYDPAATDFGHSFAADFRIEQFETARVVQTVFPQDTANVEAKIDLRATFTGRGNNLQDLMDGAAGGFTLEGSNGVVRLTLPHQEMASSLVVLGGAVTLSPELRALGRLLRKFAEMPVDHLRISGERDASGEVRLSELAIDSAQARLRGRGRVAAMDAPLMERPLEVSLELAARDEMAVILARMGLLEKRRDEAGYQAMREAFTVGGKAGEPDTRPLYDLLARAVAGSKGTWGFLMRKVQREIEKRQPPPDAAPVRNSARR